MDLKVLRVKMVTDGLPRDDDNSVFMGWCELLHQSAHVSSDAGAGAINHTCLKINVRRVSPVIL